MIQNECDKKEKIVKQLYMSQGKVTELVEAGYTVTIRPVKEGLKVTYHKEKVVKQDELYSHRKNNKDRHCPDADVEQRSVS